ncbi:uncharacterized protein DUF4294 [Mucilaginibacter gracilis]|uniref:Uncharacterized protein DUF4294 n=1 Tax=Mucilaginibacter gracilis TaxID=423350 RepID=A0A495J0T9_9SPHI|nr:DUF4294 domain-containing protein [Mucilaginibacter gracilis]RKR82595.1 uncharacterized protein DUF4294 [Mucilaginibacter gracilis]
MKLIGYLLVFCFCFGTASAQQGLPPKPKLGKNDTIRVASAIVDNEYIPWIMTPDAQIRDVRTFKTPLDRTNFYRLRYNVLKVEPYAIYAGNRYRQLERDLATTADKGKQKEMVKTCEKEIKDLFNHEIKNMSITQGEILIKLVNRESGNTSYELVKELKGGLNAFMFQSLARIFGHNLKQTYDPQEENDIEAILNSAGYQYHRN